MLRIINAKDQAPKFLTFSTRFLSSSSIVPIQEPYTTLFRPRRRPSRCERHRREHDQESQQFRSINGGSQPPPWRGRALNNRGSIDHKAQVRAFSTQSPPPSAAPSTQTEAQVPPSSEDTISPPLFTDLAKDGLIHPVLLETITQDLRFKRMAPVQAATMYPLLKDECDMMVRAKPGTSANIAFLVPAIQKMIHRDKDLMGQVSLLVFSPSRVLASRTAEDARALLQRLGNFSVCTATSGTDKREESERIRRGCDILIATPSRLRYHISKEGDAILGKLQNIDTLVFNEADQLVGLKFASTIRKILDRYLSLKNTSRERRSILFAATIFKNLGALVKGVLSADFKGINTIHEVKPITHKHIPQKLIVANTFSDVGAILLSELRKERKLAGPDIFKAIVSAPTEDMADFYASVLQKCLDLPPIVALPLEVTETERDRIAAEFRQATSQILITTELAARGIDLASVANVFQVGIPPKVESYVNQVGRAAYANTEGQATLIVTSHELFFPKRKLEKFKLEEMPADVSARKEFLDIAKTLGPDAHEKVYQSWLTYYKRFAVDLGWDAKRLVREASKFAVNGMGAADVPSLEEKVTQRVDLKTKSLNKKRKVPDPQQDEEDQDEIFQQMLRARLNDTPPWSLGSYQPSGTNGRGI